MSRIPAAAMSVLGLCAGLLVAGQPATEAAGRATPGAATSLTTTPYGTLAVSDAAAGTVEVFAPGATAGAAPLRTLTAGPADDQLHGAPGAPRFDRAGNLWVTDEGTRVLEFAPGATGAAHAIRVIEGPATGLESAAALAFAPDGSVWVGQCADCSGSPGSSSLAEFALGAHGNASPLRTITGPTTGLGEHYVPIDVSPDGSLVWTATGTAVEAFSTAAQGDSAPVSTLVATNRRPEAIALDGYGSVFVAGEVGTTPFSGYVAEYTPDGTNFPAGTSAQAAAHEVVGSGSNQATQGMVLLPGGRLLVDCSSCEQIGTYDLRSGQGVQPEASLAVTGSGISAYLSSPGAVGPVAAAVSNTQITLSWSKPAMTGGAIQGYLVERSRSATGPFAPVGIPTTPRLVDQDVAVKHRYYYRVQAYNTLGLSAATSVSAFAGTPPGAPRSPAAAAGTRSILLSWRAPKVLGTPRLKAYEVEVAPCNLTAPSCRTSLFTVGASTFAVLVDKLTPGVRYHLRVLVVNPAGADTSTTVTATPHR